jgi:hypothetical protein
MTITMRFEPFTLAFDEQCSSCPGLTLGEDTRNRCSFHRGSARSLSVQRDLLHFLNPLPGEIWWRNTIFFLFLFVRSMP